MSEAVNFIGCPEAESQVPRILAAATCPDCGRKGKVAVTTDAIIHKTMLCVECSNRAVERPLGVVPTPESEFDDFWGFGG